MSTQEPTREELIALCEAAIVPTEHWWNRDSSGAQKQIGEAWALLRAGAKWTLSPDPRSDKHTWWLLITYQGFGSFDWGGPESEDLFYIPTRARLDARDGDWY